MFYSFGEEQRRNFNPIIEFNLKINPTNLHSIKCNIHRMYDMKVKHIRFGVILFLSAKSLFFFLKGKCGIPLSSPRLLSTNPFGVRSEVISSVGLHIFRENCASDAFIVLILFYLQNSSSGSLKSSIDVLQNLITQRRSSVNWHDAS